MGGAAVGVGPPPVAITSEGAGETVGESVTAALTWPIDTIKRIESRVMNFMVQCYVYY